MGCYGQDWASYQSPAPDVTGLSFAFVKATEGLTYVNPRWSAQVAYARLHKLTVGHYHYPHMANDPVIEADFFMNVAKPQSGDVLVLDWEGYDAANKGVSQARQAAYKKAFLSYLHGTQPLHQVGTYCNTDYLDRDPSGPYGDFLWIATANRPAGQPGISHQWLFHQYSAGSVDKDFCPLSAADLAAWAHAKEEDVALTAAEMDAIALKVWGYINTKSGDKHDMHEALTNVEAQGRANGSALTALTSKVNSLAAGGVDLDLLAAKVADLLAKRLQS